MRTDRCPGCGAAYNGKKCHACGFEPFEKNTGQKPTGRKKTSAQHQQKSAFRSLIGFLIILALIALMLPILRNWGLRLETMENANVSIIQTVSD